MLQLLQDGLQKEQQLREVSWKQDLQRGSGQIENGAKDP